MSEIKSIKCPYCGSIDGIEINNDKCKCGYCDCEFFISSEETTILLNEAQNYLARYKFTDADETYCNLASAAKDAENYNLYAMAEWGRLLASFGVVYVRSINGKVSIPTFTKYDSRFDSVKKSEFYNNIMNSEASHDVKNKYKHMALKLDETYRRIKEELKKGFEYDVFICVKISLATENNPTLDGYTKDSMTANNLYDELTRRGLRVFYSQKCCQGIEYDSQILSALLRSKMLLVISTQKDYLESAWVQSEWRRWLNLINREEKKKNSLMLYIPNYDEGFELPAVLYEKKIQYFTDSILTVNHIVDTIKKYNDNNKTNLITDKKDSIINEINNESLQELEELKNKANEGDAISQYKLGVCYATGNGVKQDDIEAFNYFKKASQQGNADAQYYLAEAYYNGKGLQVNNEEAFKYYKLAADQDHSIAQVKLANCYMTGKGTPKDEQVGLEYYKKAANLNNEDAQNILGEFYYNGFLFTRNYEEAFKLFKLASDQKSAKATYNIGICYETGHGLAKNIDKAINYYVLAKEYGLGSYYHIANLYEENLHDFVNAIKYYELSISNYEEDTKIAYFKLGDIYMNGEGVKVNTKKAFKYYNLSYESGYKPAADKLVYCYTEGCGVKKNLVKANQYYEEIDYYKAQENKELIQKEKASKIKAFKITAKWVIKYLFLIVGICMLPFIKFKFNLNLSIIATSLFGVSALFYIAKHIGFARADYYGSTPIKNIVLEIVNGILSLIGVILVVYFNLFIHHPTDVIDDNFSFYTQLYFISLGIGISIILILMHVTDNSLGSLIGIFTIQLGLIVYLSVIIFSEVIPLNPTWWEYYFYITIIFGTALFLIALLIALALAVYNNYLNYWYGAIDFAVIVFLLIVSALIILCAICCWDIWKWPLAYSVIYIILVPFLIGGVIRISAKILK